MRAPTSTSSTIGHTFDMHMANFWANLLLRYQAVPAAPKQKDGSAVNSVFGTNANPFYAFGPAPVNRAIAVAELALDAAAIWPNLYFIWLLARRHDLHNNLRVLLGSFSICLILIAVTRIPTQISYICTGVLYIDAFKWLVFAHEIAVMFFRTIIVPLTVERVLATVRSKHYEQQQSPMVGICGVLLTLLLSSVIGIYIGSELNESRIRDGVISFKGDFYGLYHIIDVTVRLFIWVLCFTVFVALLLYNQRCYAFSRLPNKHTLVQRYQFAENVRSSRQLLAVGCIVFVCNLLFDFVMLRIAYNKDHFDVEYSQAFDFVLAAALNAIPIAAIGFHASMCSAFKSHFGACSSWLLPSCLGFHSRTVSSAQALTFEHSDAAAALARRQKSPRALLSGQKLIFHRAEEQQVYFEELRKSWGDRRPHSVGRRSTDASMHKMDNTCLDLEPNFGSHLRPATPILV